MKRSLLDTEDWEDPNRLDVDKLKAVLDKFRVRYDQDDLRPQLFSRYVQLAKVESPASIERWIGYKLNGELPVSGVFTVQKLKIVLAFFSTPFYSQSKRADLVRLYKAIGTKSTGSSTLGAACHVIPPTGKKRKTPIPNNRSARSKREATRKSSRKYSPISPRPRSTASVLPAPEPLISRSKRPRGENNTIQPRSKRPRRNPDESCSPQPSPADPIQTRSKRPRRNPYSFESCSPQPSPAVVVCWSPGLFDKEPSPSEDRTIECCSSQSGPSVECASSPGPSDREESRSTQPATSPSVERASSPGPPSDDKLCSPQPALSPSEEQTSDPVPSELLSPQLCPRPSVEFDSRPGPSDHAPELQSPQPAPSLSVERTSSPGTPDDDQLCSPQPALSPSEEQTSPSVLYELLSPQPSPSPSVELDSRPGSSDHEEFQSPQPAPSPSVEYTASPGPYDADEFLSPHPSSAGVSDVKPRFSPAPSSEVDQLLSSQPTHRESVISHAGSIVDEELAPVRLVSSVGSEFTSQIVDSSVPDLHRIQANSSYNPLFESSQPPRGGVQTQYRKKFTPAQPDITVNRITRSSVRIVESPVSITCARDVSPPSHGSTRVDSLTNSQIKRKPRAKHSIPDQVPRKGTRRAREDTPEPERKSKRHRTNNSAATCSSSPPPSRRKGRQRVQKKNKNQKKAQTHTCADVPSFVYKPPVSDRSDASVALSPHQLSHGKERRRVRNDSPDPSSQRRKRRRPNQNASPSKELQASRKTRQSRHRKEKNDAPDPSFVYRPPNYVGNSAVDFSPSLNGQTGSYIDQSFPTSPHSPNSSAAFTPTLVAPSSTQSRNHSYFLRSSPSESSFFQPPFSPSNQVSQWQSPHSPNSSAAVTPTLVAASSSQSRNHSYFLRSSPSESSFRQPPFPPSDQVSQWSASQSPGVQCKQKRRLGDDTSYAPAMGKRRRANRTTTRPKIIRPSRKIRQSRPHRKINNEEVPSFVYRPPIEQVDSGGQYFPDVVEFSPPQSMARQTNSYPRSLPSTPLSSIADDLHAPDKRTAAESNNNKERKLNSMAIRPPTPGPPCRRECPCSHTRSSTKRAPNSNIPNSPYDQVPFVYRPPHNGPVPSMPPSGHAIPLDYSDHPDNHPTENPFLVSHNYPPNPLSPRLTHLPAYSCRPGIESWRTSLPPTNPDDVMTLGSKLDSFAPQVISELQQISQGIGRLQQGPVAGPSGRAPRNTSRDNTLSARIRIHVAILFGKGFSAQRGHFPPAATRVERSSWQSTPADNWSDDEELSSESSLDLEEQDSSFPYPGGPGHSRASPQALLIIRRVMRKAGVHSFRPDFTKSMNHPNNKPLWNIAYYLFLKLTQSGEYDDIDLEFHSEHRIYQALTAHVKYLTRCFRESMTWTGAAKDAVKARRRRVTRRANRCRARVEYLITQPQLAPLIEVVQKCTSDDETDDEWDAASDDGSEASDSKPVAVLDVPWRHPRIQRMMITLEKLIALQGSSRLKRSKTGGKPTTKRLRSRRTEPSSIPCPRSLPADCYNGEWLKHQQPSFVSNLSIQSGPNLRPIAKFLENLL